MYAITIETRKVAITAMYCHLRLPNAIAKHFQFNIFWGFKYELQMNPMPFHLQSLWGATLLPHRGCAMDWDKTK